MTFLSQDDHRQLSSELLIAWLEVNMEGIALYNQIC